MGRYELPTNLQNLTQKDLTEVKIFQKVLGGEGGALRHTKSDSDLTCCGWINTKHGVNTNFYNIMQRLINDMTCVLCVDCAMVVRKFFQKTRFVPSAH